MMNKTCSELKCSSINEPTIVFEKRATTIIYNLLQSSNKEGIFLLPANICPIVPLAFLKAHRKFELIDISPKTFCLDEELVVRKISKQPSAYAGIVYARTYGAVYDCEDFFRQLKGIHPELLIIDDRCLAPPDFFPQPGTCSDLVLYSTGYSKVVEIGWGGFGFLRKDLPYHRTNASFSPQALLAVEASYKGYLTSRTPFAYQDCDWLDTAVPRFDFSEYRHLVEAKLALSLEHKAEINNIYSLGLPPEIQLAAKYQHWRFNVIVPRRNSLLDKIFQMGLFASMHYAALGGIFAVERMPVAEELHGQIINLFNDFHFDTEKAQVMVRIINDHLAA